MQYKTEVGKSFGYNTQIKDLTIVTKPSYYYLTSTIYPLEFLDDLSTSVLNTDGRSSHKDDLGVQRFNQDTTSTSFTDITGTLKVALKVYEYSRTEEDIDKVQGSISSVTGVLRLLLLSSTMKVENTLTSFTGISGVLRSALIAYNFYKQESTLSLITALEAIYINVQTSFESYVKGTSTVYSYPVVMNNVMFTSTVQTMSFSTSTLSTTDTSGYTLVFREPLTEVDAKNVVLIFGRNQSNLPKDPEVIINEYTTSALDFENDLIDKVSTTIWNKEGTGNVTSVNKIFGNNSFETKTLGDSLSTTSNIITGGATPFTIEFYALVKSSQGFNQYVTLLSSNNNIIDGAQFIYLHPTNGYKLSQYRGANGGSFINGIRENSGYQNIKFNEINKYTITYDGAALRYFVNDKYDLVLGTSVGYSQNNLPFSFLNTSIPVDTSYDQSTQGLIDNINIFDGVATKVRDYDEHADKLIIDLAFDGENNSTKIVDNGTEKLTFSVVSGNVKISTEQKFDGYSSLKNNRDGYIISNTQPITSSDISTISFEFYIENINTNNVYYDTYDGSYNNTFQLLNYGGKFVLWYSNITVQITTLENQSKNKITFIYNNRNVKVYVNGYLKLDTTLDIDLNFGNKFALFGQGVYPNPNYYSDGYFKNFKIYKGVEVIPEDPTGKIQLDFDNNVTDKYNNSTWTNNGVTFDQVNSVKGYSAKFNGSNSILSISNNQNLNFENKNFVLSYDFKNAIFDSVNNRYLLGNGMAFAHGAFWRLFGTSSNKYGSVNLNYNSTNYGLTNTVEVENNYYNEKILRNSDTLVGFKNDVAISALNVINTFNVDFKNMSIGTASSLTGGVSYFNGYIDNFKSIKDYQEPVIIDKPAVHLPLETNATNIGFTPLTINIVGNPTYTTIEGKKCIKFESGKYLTITSNNIFNVGSSSDFYIEFELYITTLENRMFLISSMSLWTSPNDVCYLHISTKGELSYYHTNNSTVIFSKKSNENVILVNQWQKLIFKRTNGICSISINNTNILDFTSLVDISNGGTSIGANSNPADVADYVRGYMSNFKMFVGTSEIPETYNDKKVLDLDFKPTRKSYLFKDNNNKCIIHPINITQRDYQDSQYCCTFNGTNQYLELGKNDLLNFGLDDFIIAIKFKVVSSGNTWNTILSGASTYTYIDIQSNGTLHVCLDQNSTSTVGTIPFNTIVTLIISVKNNILSVYVNNVKVPMSLTSTSIVNFNESNNTFIGAYGALSTYFNGTIYSIKVLRNTTDLTLLDTEEESGGGEDDYTPITLSLNTPSTVENPVEGSYTNIYGVIRYADLLPTVTVMFNGNEVNQEDITLTSRGTSNDIEQDYDLQIRILNDALDGTYPVTVTVDDTSDVANGSTNLIVIRDYPLLTQGLDSFNTSWYQLSNTNKVVMRNHQEELMMYFNGLSSLTANGYSWKFGLDKFTIELDFVITKSPTTNNYHILSCGKTESWYAIEITSNREIRFLNRGTVKVSTATNAISVDTKYRLAITRDSNYNLRIFLNGTKVAEAIDNSNYTFDEDPSDLNHNVFLGRVGTLHTDTIAEKHFKGYMNNFYFNKGVCLYTENYTPTVLDKGITTKSLLTFTSDDVGFTTKVDSFNPNITWTNSGCTVVNNQLVLGSVSNRLVSTENDLFNFTNQNWTIDIIGTTSQITTEAVLFDNRLSGSSFNGILIRQSPSDPTSITISLGISTATGGYSYIINTGVNSLVANTEFNLKIVRSLGQLAVFFNGVRKNRTTIYTNSFETSKTVCIGNNKEFNKGFNGKIKQVRIINGIATDVHAYPVIEGNILT